MSDNFDVEDVPQPKRKVEKYKWHVETTDPEIKELDKKYDVIQGSNHAIANLDHNDVIAMFEKYGSRPDVDLYTIAQALHISDVTLGKLCKSEEYKEAYQSAKAKRGELLALEGYHVASEPYQKCLQGEEIDSVFVKACQLKANYNLAMAKVMNPEYAGTGNNNSSNNGVNLIINTGFKVNL